MTPHKERSKSLISNKALIKRKQSSASSNNSNTNKSIDYTQRNNSQSFGTNRGDAAYSAQRPSYKTGRSSAEKHNATLQAFKNIDEKIEEEDKNSDKISEDEEEPKNKKIRKL